MKRLIVVVAAVSAALVMSGVPVDAAQKPMLKPAAFTCEGGGWGNALNVQAKWTNKAALEGKQSILLEKTAATTHCSYAAAVFTGSGIEGDAMAGTEVLSFWVKGSCAAGSPRFNLFFDNDGDGAWDGYKLWGCSGYLSGATSGDWSEVSVTTGTPGGVDTGNFIPGVSTIVQLSVLADDTGSSNVDKVTYDTITVGESNGS